MSEPKTPDVEDVEYEVEEEVDLPDVEDTPEDDVEELDVNQDDLPDGEEAGE